MNSRDKQDSASHSAYLIKCSLWPWSLTWNLIRSSLSPSAPKL